MKGHTIRKEEVLVVKAKHRDIYPRERNTQKVNMRYNEVRSEVLEDVFHRYKQGLEIKPTIVVRDQNRTIFTEYFQRLINPRKHLFGKIERYLQENDDPFYVVGAIESALVQAHHSETIKAIEIEDDADIFTIRSEKNEALEAGIQTYNDMLRWIRPETERIQLIQNQYEAIGITTIPRRITEILAEEKIKIEMPLEHYFQHEL